MLATIQIIVRVSRKVLCHRPLIEIIFLIYLHCVLYLYRHYESVHIYIRRNCTQQELKLNSRKTYDYENENFLLVYIASHTHTYIYAHTSIYIYNIYNFPTLSCFV